MSSNADILISGLSKRFGRVQALESLDLRVERGSVHGFLGPNGAGKTTIIKIMLGLVSPDSGSVIIRGRDLFREKRRILSEIGAVVEAPVFFPYLSACENLYYLARLSDPGLSRSRIRETLGIVGLESVADRTVGGFSYGMRQRLGIAQALLPESRLIFLDEPTNGLDPHGIVGVRRLVRHLVDKLGITIFLSSHMLSEVEQVCDNVTIIDHGRKIREAPVGDLLEGRRRICLKTRDREGFAKFAADCGLVYDESSAPDDEAGIYLLSGSERCIADMVRKLVAAGISVDGIDMRQDNLEDIFVELTGKDQANPATDRF